MYNGDQTKTFNGLSCEGTLDKLGTNIQSYEKGTMIGFIIALQCLFYALIPISALAFFSTIIETFTRYDCKRVMQVSLFNASIISLTMIIVGIIFDLRCR